MKISNLTKERIRAYLEKGNRFDGRSLDEYRDIEINFDVSENAEGSVEVKIGETKVMAGIKMDVGEPYTDSEDQGILITTAELLGMASSEFEPGPPKFEAIELARIVDRGIRESKMIDFKKLCIKKGEKVWVVFVDIYVINDDGNLIDAAALAAVAALLRTKIPKYNEKTETVEYGELTNKKLPIIKEYIPLTFTAHKINNQVILDPCKLEDETSEARISLAISMGKKIAINAGQKGGEINFTEQEIFEIIDLVIKKAKTFYPELIKKITD